MMNILLAADGSRYTKKALAFLMANRDMWTNPSGAESTLNVIHVQTPMPPRVRSAVGVQMIDQYFSQESEKVFKPVEKYLRAHDVSYKTQSVVGNINDEIIKAAKRCKAHMIVMGTHGHGVIGRMVMGSVAQRVITGCDVPVLLVK
jgi:nucleotide-binding universal stress UspA family protein